MSKANWNMDWLTLFRIAGIMPPSAHTHTHSHRHKKCILRINLQEEKKSSHKSIAMKLSSFKRFESDEKRIDMETHECLNFKQNDVKWNENELAQRAKKKYEKIENCLFITRQMFIFYFIRFVPFDYWSSLWVVWIFEYLKNWKWSVSAHIWKHRRWWYCIHAVFVYYYCECSMSTLSHSDRWLLLFFSFVFIE